MDFKNILIVGIGLIGGSILHALKERSFSGRIYGIDTNKSAVSSAYELGLILNKDTNLPKELDDLCVIISVPVLSVEDALSQIDQIINKEDVIYTDTLSVKSSILEILKTLDSRVLKQFVLSHPIAGSEQSGFFASSPNLFEDKLSIICPHDNNAEKDILRIEEFWKYLGSYTKKISASEHDDLFAKTSHMPHVISYSLMNSLYKDLGDNTFFYSGGSLEDYTRIASSDPIMWKDIMVSNHEPILSSLNAFKKSLDDLSNLIEKNDSDGLVDFFSEVKNARDKSILKKED